MLYNELVDLLCFLKYCDTVAEEDEARTTHFNRLQPAGQHNKLTISTMSLLVILLVVSLASQCWTAPQRRNWTPQAILYLKGAQGHRSVMERTSRDEGNTLHLVTHNQSSGGLGSSLTSLILLELLQQAVEEGGSNPDPYPDYQKLNINHL